MHGKKQADFACCSQHATLGCSGPHLPAPALCGSSPGRMHFSIPTQRNSPLYRAQLGLQMVYAQKTGNRCCLSSALLPAQASAEGETPEMEPLL